MTLRDSQNTAILIESNYFASGGEGNVYRIISPNKYQNYCVKLFHGDKVFSRLDKLEYMINHPLRIPSNTQYKICWPTDFVYNNSQPVGFIMPLAFSGSKSLYSLYLKDDNSIFDRRKDYGIRNRFKLLFNIANAISNLHHHGYIIVDFKPQNLLFSDAGQISLIDLDSIQIMLGDLLLYSPTAFTQEYAYPKEINNISQKKPCSKYWDTYSFAIVAYQLLTSIHPFIASSNLKTPGGDEISDRLDFMRYNLYPLGKNASKLRVIPPPHYYINLLPYKIQDLFEQTFDLDKSCVLMEDWMATLLESINNDILRSNPFREKKKPIFILRTRLPNEAAAGDFLEISWFSANISNLTINGNVYTNQNTARFKLNESLSLNIVASNSQYKCSYEYSMRTSSAFCINCGRKYYSSSDTFCTYCGIKKV